MNTVEKKLVKAAPKKTEEIIMKKKSPSKAESYRRMLELSTAETE